MTFQLPDLTMLLVMIVCANRLLPNLNELKGEQKTLFTSLRACQMFFLVVPPADISSI